MNYGNILTNAWKTIWKHKVIIWFGLLMMVAPALLGLFMGGALSFSSLESIEQFSENSFNGLGLFLIVLGYLVFIILTVALSALSFAGVLKGTLLLQGREETLSFAELWDESMPYLGRILGVIFIVGSALFLAFFLPISLMAIIGAVTAGVGFLCLFPVILLMMPLGLVGYLLLSLSMSILVAEDLSVFASIQRAGKIMRTKFWALILMTIILYIIQVAVGFVIAIPLNVMQFAFIIPMSNNDIDPNTFFQTFGVIMALFIPLSSIVQSLGTTYANAAWLFAYLEVSPEAEETVIEYA